MLFKCIYVERRDVIKKRETEMLGKQNVVQQRC